MPIIINNQLVTCVKKNGKEIIKIYKNNEMKYKKGIIPPGDNITLVDYITNPQLTCINVGYMPNANSEMYIWLQPYITHPIYGNNSTFYFGARKNFNDACYDCQQGGSFGNQNFIGINICGKYNYNMTPNVYADGNYHKIGIKNESLYIDDVYINDVSGSKNYSYLQQTNGIDLFFTSLYPEAEAAAPFTGKCKEFIIIENGVTLYDLKAAYNSTNNQYGMYDVINNKMYYSFWEGLYFSGGFENE